MTELDHAEEPAVNKISNGDGEARPVWTRRSSRVVIDIPVTLFGQSLDRKMFKEQAKTLTVSAHGALVSLQADVDSQRPVLMANPKTGMEVQCRVAYRKSTRDGGSEIGLEFATSLPKFWGIHFPPEDWDPAARKKATSPERAVDTSARGSKR
jgi:hypothetical protein